MDEDRTIRLVHNQADRTIEVRTETTRVINCASGNKDAHKPAFQDFEYNLTLNCGRFRLTPGHKTVVGQRFDCNIQKNIP